MVSGALTRWLAANDSFTVMGALRTLAARHGAWSSWLVVLTWTGCLAAFVTDLASANTLAFGVFYMPLVATAVFHRDRGAVWVLTAIACVLVIIGSFLPHIAQNVDELVVNRVLSICAILITAAFVWRARLIQDRLEEQTAQAEASERIRGEVLTNLSNEIRAPLHGMIGVLELVAANSDPGHRAALTMVRASGRRLATMVDNLVDLTQLDGMALPREPFDLGALTRQITEARRRDAADRQITLTISVAETAGAPPFTRSNQWAVRRILENKIGDAIASTAPGGRIAVSVLDGPEEHAVVINSSSAAWPLKHFDPSLTPLAPSAMGLALSQRLALAIGGRLAFSGGSADQAVVRLTLPVVREDAD